MAVHNVWSGALDFSVFLFERDRAYDVHFFVGVFYLGWLGWSGFLFLTVFILFYPPLFDGYFSSDFSFQLYGSVLIPIFLVFFLPSTIHVPLFSYTEALRRAGHHLYSLV